VGGFSLARFYERRVRRIFPALFLILTACCVAGALLFDPVDLKHLGESVAATALFASNILFWIQTGYFDSPADERPLLHTWSLAVEEQFYVFFPLYLIVTSKFFPTFGILCCSDSPRYLSMGRLSLAQTLLMLTLAFVLSCIVFRGVTLSRNFAGATGASRRGRQSSRAWPRLHYLR
jgi:peptidoglycan/LPS O-acetylase OafA/YrhL